MNSDQKDKLQRYERATHAKRQARQALNEACAEANRCAEELLSAVYADEASWNNTPGRPPLPTPKPKRVINGGCVVPRGKDEEMQGGKEGCKHRWLLYGWNERCCNEKNCNATSVGMMYD